MIDDESFLMIGLTMIIMPFSCCYAVLNGVTMGIKNESPTPPHPVRCSVAVKKAVLSCEPTETEQSF